MLNLYLTQIVSRPRWYCTQQYTQKCHLLNTFLTRTSLEPKGQQQHSPLRHSASVGSWLGLLTAQLGTALARVSCNWSKHGSCVSPCTLLPGGADAPSRVHLFSTVCEAGSPPSQAVENSGKITATAEPSGKTPDSNTQ